MLSLCLWISFCGACFGSSMGWLEDFVFDVENEDDAIEDALTNKQNDCRLSSKGYLSPDVFALFSCAKCYGHMDKRLFPKGTKFKVDNDSLIDPSTNQKHKANISDFSNPVFKSFTTEKAKNHWIDCCHAAVKCCKIMRQTPLPTSDSYYCPRTWDGWNCWPDTPNGSIAESRCPPYIYFHSEEPYCPRFSTKQCLNNSSWFKNHRGNEYSNYSTCGKREDIKNLLNAHTISFGISMILLIPALIIFYSYRQLRVPRVFMHKNLFISLLCTSTSIVIFESYVMTDSFYNFGSSILESNNAWCKIGYTITKYFRLSTYVWMFCEGFYLHKLIVTAFAEEKSLLVYVLVGWGFPIIPVSIWAIIRKTHQDDLCWTVPSGYIEWALFVPMFLALLLNFCFLAHIIQVIVVKLKSTHADEPTQFRRAVRATLVLIPLFGLHFLFLIYHPHKGGCLFLRFYSFATHLIDGLQGGIVSLIFCYCNNEVIFLLKRSYNRRRMIRNIGSHRSSRRTARGSSVSTNAESMIHDLKVSENRSSLSK